MEQQQQQQLGGMGDKGEAEGEESREREGGEGLQQIAVPPPPSDPPSDSPSDSPPDSPGRLEPLPMGDDGIVHCPVADCHYSSPLQNSVKTHLKGVHSSQGRPYACSLCSATFKLNGALTGHVEKVHMLKDQRPIKCTVRGCKVRVKTRANLLDHMDNVHNEEKPFECDVPGCGMVFKKQFGLNRHRDRAHSGKVRPDAPFKCPKGGCGRNFKSAQKLRDHFSRVHADTPLPAELFAKVKLEAEKGVAAAPKPKPTRKRRSSHGERRKTRTTQKRVKTEPTASAPSSSTERGRRKKVRETVSVAKDIAMEPVVSFSCKICSSPHDEDLLLLCDACDGGFHTYCLDPPLTSIPGGDFFCPRCTPSQTSSGLSRRARSGNGRMERTQCSGRTRDGSQCLHHALGDFCKKHQKKEEKPKAEIRRMTEAESRGRDWSAAGIPAVFSGPARLDTSQNCRVCDDPQHEDLLLLCDACNAAVHTYCLTPPLRAIPEGDFFCPQCEDLDAPPPGHECTDSCIEVDDVVVHWL